MRDWRIIDDRRAATIIFRDIMEKPANADRKKKCCDNPTEAKKQFAILGEFYLHGETLAGQPAKPANVNEIEIPEIVEFRVYDSKDEQRRNELVVLVLPSSKGEMSAEPTDIWIAGWPQWKTIEEMIAHLEAQLEMLRQALAGGK